MIGYVEGYSDTDEHNYCPKCGEEIYTHKADGTSSCDCGYEFAVIEVDCY